MEGDPNVGSSSSSANKKRNRTSKVWDEMTEVNRGGKVKAACKHCKKEFPADSKDGTTRLWNHLHRCRDNPKRKGPGGRDRDDQHQSLSPSIKTKELASLIKEKEKSIRGLIKHWFDPEGDTSDPWVFISRRDEILQLLKSRQDEILQLYQEEKENLCQFLKKLSCRFTLQIANGSVLVVHYINDCWERQSKIISFWEDPLDDFENLVEAVKQSCLDWKIDTNICFLLHVERNDPEDERHDEIAEMLRGFSQRRSLPFAGCLLDAVYFLDYIYGKLWTVDYLQDGIESLSIWADYVYNKDRRFFLLDGALKRAISWLKWPDASFCGLLDCFETMGGLKEVFSALEQFDSDFRSINLSKQKWDEVTATFEHLKFLRDVIDSFLWWETGDIPIIVDLPYVHKILKDRRNHTIEDCLFCQKVMKGAIDLFLSKHYSVRVIAVILDPRLKMDGVRLHYKEIYGRDADRYIEKVNKDFRDVYDAYAATDSSSSKSYEMLDATSSPKSELDLYMKELKVPAVQQFNILAWWRGNAPFYPTLARMARDYLALESPFDDEDGEDALFDLQCDIRDINKKFKFCDLPEIITPLLCLEGILGSCYL
ncbi:zinc finger BED domain-containing protein RICESLEEPER 3-like isoform X3 [Citrus sinensis]|uniref:zinc finger BED domain-containing protein RICESLEEPER 3-like isoform X3 n=1 Tax=Citrus sinensis TaxID=2711 RepID=UPI00227788C4|nr:zinc finger BED domain-containing protein RICESLEEPER 3-like isoform X3 [Citrus sinensis]